MNFYTFILKQHEKATQSALNLRPATERVSAMVA